MATVDVSDIRPGNKIELEGEPCACLSNEFVKPGKGQPFNRVKLKNILTGRVLERTFKSGERLQAADVEEQKMRLLYRDGDSAHFMQDQSFEQVAVAIGDLGETKNWLVDDTEYTVVLYRGSPISVSPPTFMDLKVIETSPGVRGDTASGRVLKPAITETGSKVQIPIFIEEGEVCRFDTRDSSYVGRTN